ncbi:hypothetical protein DH2020_026280 [Rehmannia glutinosa]|uniref:Bifunctional inhibitor/plant lipid transfer protein/seed storage helical domain-containing protein n=1 Tax=Rehmannia glutinosa TaxID=99300 RepID=A0ABR0VXC0_REHGL
MATKKITLAAALLVALVAVATATTYTTTVTTTTFDEEGNPGQQQQCQRQLQGRQFRSCQRYLSQRSPYNEEDEVLEMSTGNPGQQMHLSQCCQQLKNVNEQCRCEAIRHAVRQLQQGGQEEMGQSQVYQRATELPRKCNMRPQQCQIRLRPGRCKAVEWLGGGESHLRAAATSALSIDSRGER